MKWCPYFKLGFVMLCPLIVYLKHSTWTYIGGLATWFCNKSHHGQFKRLWATRRGFYQKTSCIQSRTSWYHLTTSCRQQLDMTPELKLDLQDSVDWNRRWLVGFNAGKIQLVFVVWSHFHLSVIFHPPS